MRTLLSCTPYVVPEKHSGSIGSIRSILEPLISPARLERISLGLAARSRSVLCVFESTHHSHNISAVMRTIDAMGFLEAIFVYENASMRFRSRDSVERGASQWLLARRSNTISGTGQWLRRAGYQVLLVSRPDFATTAPSFRSDLPHLCVDRLGEPACQALINTHPIALIFGSELQGVHQDWIEHASGYISVPMFGFVESLNLSVCAGILLQAFRARGAEKLNSLEESLVSDFWLARATTGSRRTVLALNPQLSGYYDFVVSGRFFDPFPQSHYDRL
jgi:tRNA (guanosine-2'-O-)-methyltransferase